METRGSPIQADAMRIMVASNIREAHRCKTDCSRTRHPAALLSLNSRWVRAKEVALTGSFEFCAIFKARTVWLCVGYDGRSGFAPSAGKRDGRWQPGSQRLERNAVREAEAGRFANGASAETI